MKLTLQQQQVFDQIKEFLQSDASVFILKGYAGTGKTTMIKILADYISKSHSIELMAPTGRAARVLSDKTNYDANTIHSTIYGKATMVTKDVKDIADSELKLYFPVNITQNKIVAIIDEASMLCSKTIEHELIQFGTDNLMDDLLTFVRPSYGGKIIFVGDPAQLPPIGEPVSQALNAAYFTNKGLKVMQAILTEVLRQTSDSVILKNAMQIRELLDSKRRNHLVFEEKSGEVESLPSNKLLSQYLYEKKLEDQNDCVMICYSNKTACEYNKLIREQLYGRTNPELRIGDVLMIVQNNHQLNWMNGEFVKVSDIGEIIKQSAPVYVQERGNKVKKIIELSFQIIQATAPSGYS